MTTKTKIIISVSTIVIAGIVIMIYINVQNKKSATRNTVNGVLTTNIPSTATPPYVG